MKLPAPHRIARLFYGPRVVSFGLSFVGSALLVSQGYLSTAFLPFAGLLFLVYPHLVYLHACFAARKKQSELNHLVLDAILLGGWSAVIDFNVGLSFSFLTAVSLNNTMVGGLGRLAASLAAFAGGALLLGAMTGFDFKPAASLSVTVLGLLGMLIYMTVVALLFHRQNQRMLAVLKENESKRLLFEMLAAAGLASAGAGSLEEVLDACLEHLQKVIRPGRGIGLLVRDRGRADVVYCAAFRGFSVDQQPALVASAQGIARASVQLPGGERDAGPEAQWSVIGLPTTQLEALFVIDRDQLAPAESRAVEIFLQQLTGSLQNQALTLRLRELANTDGLTGLANRARLDDCLSDAITRKLRAHGSDFSIIVADVDGLKALNDSRGHEAGDRLIKATARLLRASCRETDIVARSGGDEFVVLCPATTTATASHLIDRLRSQMLQQRVELPLPDGQWETASFHFSLGCADSSECPPGDVQKLADRRMYEDKATYHAGSRALA